MFEIDEKGIRILGTSFWLDAERVVPLSFVSHAHADHIRNHKQIIATPETISMFELRRKKVDAIPLEYNTPYKMDGATIELFPSGHILGSAQILIEKDGVRLVYTGDLNLRTSATAAPAEIREADILIIESTFGRPEFVFPKRYLVIEQLVKFIDKCFARGIAPVILGYSLGKSQEVIKILGDLDYQISVHSSIYKMLKIYEQYGISFKNYKLYEGEDLRKRVMVIPPHIKNWLGKRYRGEICKAVVTGWAMDPRAKFRYRAHTAIPLSDHAGYDDLIKYVKQVSPQKVFITHGFSDFTHCLIREGFNAAPLRPSSQISLF
ncbi:MBL fold metallo-hydrolase [candidate division KSB1 bacterium]|nr:MBL fold metallo-hydrolase [candidate division KSB1 bacterium]